MIKPIALLLALSVTSGGAAAAANIQPAAEAPGVTAEQVETDSRAQMQDYRVIDSRNNTEVTRPAPRPMPAPAPRMDDISSRRDSAQLNTGNTVQNSALIGQTENDAALLEQSRRQAAAERRAARRAARLERERLQAANQTNNGTAPINQTNNGTTPINQTIPNAGINQTNNGATPINQTNNNATTQTNQMTNPNAGINRISGTATESNADSRYLDSMETLKTQYARMFDIKAELDAQSKETEAKWQEYWALQQSYQKSMKHVVRRWAIDRHTELFNEANPNTTFQTDTVNRHEGGYNNQTVMPTPGRDNTVTFPNIDTVNRNTVENNMDNRHLPLPKNNMDTVNRGTTLNNTTDTVNRGTTLNNTTDTVNRGTTLNNTTDTVNRGTNLNNTTDTVNQGASLNNNIDTVHYNRAVNENADSANYRIQEVRPFAG